MTFTITEFATAMMVALPLALGIRIAMVIYNRVKRRRISLAHEIGCVIFIMLLAGIYNLTIQNLITYDNLSKVLSIQLGISGGINLVPFQTIKMMLNVVNTSYGFFNLFGNILIFVPIGFSIPFLWKSRRSFLNTLLYGAGISVLIEILQLPLERGTDIDDVILNTVGVILGFMVYALVKTTAPRFADRFQN